MNYPFPRIPSRVPSASRILAISLALALCLGCLSAQDGGMSMSRRITRIGGAFTAGDSSAGGNLGYGLKTQSFEFFDASLPSGFYYGFAGADVFHSAGGVTIMDTRLATLGWRREIAGTPFAFDCSLSPVMGSRSVGNRIFGSWYIGAQPLIGLVVMAGAKFDIEIAYEPVFNLFTLFGSEEVKNMTYHDISLSILLKNLSEIRARAW